MRAPCKMDGCEKESRGRGLCATHWSRWRRRGDPNVVLVSGVDFNAKQPCAVDGCERLAHAHAFCTMHLRRWQLHGDPLHIEPIRGRPLKGDVPTWETVHKRLFRAYGPARDHQCVDCDGPAAEWSYDRSDPDELYSEKESQRGTWLLAYSLDLDHYAPRCRPCHRLFDAAPAPLEVPS